MGKVPLVIDADGLNNLAVLLKNDREIKQLFYEYKSGIILTPHLKEMSRLIEEEITEIQSNLPKAAMKMADQDHIIVLKRCKDNCI